MRTIEKWLTDEELKSIYTSLYWNDIEEEKKKEWWIEDGDYEKCLNYLKTSKLLYEYKEAEKFVKDFKAQEEVRGIRSSDIFKGLDPSEFTIIMSSVSNNRLC